MDLQLRSITRLLALGALLTAAPRALAAELPSGTITLRDALEAALRTNPGLAAAALDVRAGDARSAQARVLPNPTLDAGAENLGASAADEGSEPAQATLRLAQLIELGGKRDKRGRLAALERDGRQWDFEVRRAAILAETAELFVTVLALQERRALAADLAGVAAEFQHAVDAQVRAGAASPVDASRARVALGEARLALAERERQLAAARVALAGAWGAPEPTFQRVAGNLADIAPPQPAAAVEVGGNPDVARWSTEVAAREAALSLEQARRVPDVTVGAGPRYFIDSGQFAAVVEVGVPLPLFDRNQGAIAAAAAEVAAAGERQRAALLAARAAVGRARESVAAAYARATTLRDELIPAAESTSTSAREAYRSGALRYLEVIDAQRTWFELRDQYFAALTAYHLARIDLERLTGAELGAATSGPTSTEKSDRDAAPAIDPDSRHSVDAGGGNRP
jgi:cobalt-zinc-cadmium efflux system outer membrane protein